MLRIRSNLIRWATKCRVRQILGIYANTDTGYRSIRIGMRKHMDIGIAIGMNI